MSNYAVVLTKQAQKDAKMAMGSPYAQKLRNLIALLADDPFKSPPSFEKLLGDLEGAYLRRINMQHRLIYEVLAEEKIVKILRCWSHYDD